MMAVAWSAYRGPRGSMPGVPPSPRSTVYSPRFTDHGAHSPPTVDAEARSAAADGTDIGGLITGVVEPIPPPPPHLPAWELTIRQASLGAPPEDADPCSRSTRDGLVGFRAVAYNQAEGHLRTALERCGATLQVLFPLGLTQLVAADTSAR